MRRSEILPVFWSSVWVALTLVISVSEILAPTIFEYIIFSFLSCISYAIILTALHKVYIYSDFYKYKSPTYYRVPLVIYILGLIGSVGWPLFSWFLFISFVLLLFSIAVYFVLRKIFED